MNADHLIKLCLSDLETTKTFECFFEVGYRDEVCVINIKLLKQTPQLLIVEFLVDSKCCRNELSVVNHTVAIVVNFTYDLLNLCIIVA